MQNHLDMYNTSMTPHSSIRGVSLHMLTAAISCVQRFLSVSQLVDLAGCLHMIASEGVAVHTRVPALF